jgi:hypothetical protein
VIEWGKVPWPLWAFAAFSVAGAILIEVQISGQIPSKVLFPFIMFAWLFFLFKGVRWVWIVTLGISGFRRRSDLRLPHVARHRRRSDQYWPASGPRHAPLLCQRAAGSRRLDFPSHPARY